MNTSILESGIYRITSPTGRIYVGQSTNIKKRWNQYKRTNAKGQTRLNRSIVKHGLENHTFEIVELCEFDLLNKRERHFQECFEAIGTNGLNCMLTGTEDKSGKLSSETKSKMSINNSGKTNPFFGKKHSAKTKKILSNTHKGKKRTDKEKLQQSHSISNEKNHKAKIVLDLNTGVFYGCLKNVCELYGLKYSTMCARLNGYCKNKTQFVYC